MSIPRSDRELATVLAALREWQGIRAGHRVKALTALTVREALDAISAPNWTWTPGYFRGPSFAQPTVSQLTSFSGVG